MSQPNARTIAGLVAVALPLLLGACGVMSMSGTHPKVPPPGLAPSRCTPGNCDITVTVTNCTAPGGITVDKPLVEVSTAVNMRWTITPSTFAFAASGIQLDPPDAQFEVKPSPRPNEFHIHNHKRSNGDFYYYINVQGCAQADPFIRNN
jgi:hypothetical protein